MRSPSISLLLPSIFAFVSCRCHALQLTESPTRKLVASIQNGYQQRVAADPAFPQKSVAELFLAATTQLTAEIERRGSDQILVQFDFVLAGILTAVFGKYYSMWKVAPTQAGPFHNKKKSEGDVQLFQIKVPTNAFQATMLDGVTKPKLYQRLAAFIVPVVPLFRAGFIASSVGYGVVRIMILIRTFLLPSFEASTQNVNVLYASLYTGVFMAVVSNIRYQVLQGLIEPLVGRWFHRFPILHGALIFLIRVGNGFLGSVLAIAGMRQLGLQQVKS
ncbi:hypothetical protein FisN_3Hh314 [Fistulifera solaris]|uniref:Uncharacterized protein n=1 Tax=Fistulifera solaris TaxID=1519565 RepID=A0A1Z5JQA3_FISSO|nr:hypothetical protein FisN_3Hh314 [Fistulifera solaris]|eukprot:GAX16205.1 hypothetical protein FisN_3Hh314 [Fistulifera solaris]